MNLDDMKKSWSDMNDKLDQCQISDKDSIQRLISSKAKTGFDKLLNYEKRFLILSLVFIPYFLMPVVHRSLGRIAVAAAIFILIFAAIEQAYKLNKLRKIDLMTDSVYEISKKVAEYRAFTMKMFRFGYIVLAPGFLLIVAVSIYYYDINLSVILGVITGTILGFVAGLRIFIKHKKNIDEVLECLGELNDLDK